MTLPQIFCRRAIHWAAVAIFCVCICLPAADNLLHFAPQVDLMENAPTPLPDFSISEVFRMFNVLQRGFLDKTYGFRKQLVRWQNMLDIYVLHSSTQYQTVVAGQGQWLFLAQENAELNVVEDYRGSRLFTPEDLAWWVNVYRERQDRLAAQGIRYLIVLAPNKETVYPEFLPPQYNRVSPLNRTDQLVHALETAGVAILDLRPALFAAKHGALLYYRTDTHWTTAGAFVGYIEIMNRLSKWKPEFALTIRNDYDIQITPGLAGGLSSMLALAGLIERAALEVRHPVDRRAAHGGRAGHVRVERQRREQRVRVALPVRRDVAAQLSALDHPHARGRHLVHAEQARQAVGGDLVRPASRVRARLGLVGRVDRARELHLEGGRGRPDRAQVVEARREERLEDAILGELARREPTRSRDAHVLRAHVLDAERRARTERERSRDEQRRSGLPHRAHVY